MDTKELEATVEFEMLFVEAEAKAGDKYHCHKRIVAAGTYVNGLWYSNINRCYQDKPFCPRTSCPNEDAPEAIALCSQIHAEKGLANILLHDNLISDGIAWVTGHYFACKDCAAALRGVGVKEIRVKEKP